MVSLQLGQRVSFDAGPEHGGRLFATFVKRNRETVGLVTDDGRQWRVSPHLVTPIRDITAKPIPSPTTPGSAADYQ